MTTTRRNCPPCNGQCHQDRQCHAAEPPREPMTPRDAWIAVGLAVGSWVVVITLVRLGCWLMKGLS